MVIVFQRLQWFHDCRLINCFLLYTLYGTVSWIDLLFIIGNYYWPFFSTVPSYVGCRIIWSKSCLPWFNLWSFGFLKCLWYWNCVVKLYSNPRILLDLVILSSWLNFLLVYIACTPFNWMEDVKARQKYICHRMIFLTAYL